MKKYKKYKVVKRMATEFGRKSHVFVITKRTWLGFYWDTDSYYFKQEAAQKHCDVLNMKHRKKPSNNTCSHLYWHRAGLTNIGVCNDCGTNFYIK